MADPTFPLPLPFTWLTTGVGTGFLDIATINGDQSLSMFAAMLDIGAFTADQFIDGEQ